MKPLSHLTVVDLTVNAPGPFCSMVMSDMGARVIKVEPPGGDPLRHNPAMWSSLNRGKQSICLDLKTEGGRDVLDRLASNADVVLEGWRPGVAQRLGADYDTLSSANPRLVYCSISGFGQDGPWRDRPGHDINYLALSGYFAVQAAVEGRPWPPPVLVSDLASGLYATISVLAAISGREVSGTGAYIDLSMTESALALLGPEIWSANSAAGADGQPNVTSIPHYDLFACKDGRWLSLGIVHEDHFWRRLCEVTDLEEFVGVPFEDRLDRGSDIKEALKQVFLTRTASEWERVLLEADVPVATVASPAQLADSPQFQARGALVDLGPDRYAAQPVHFSTATVTPTVGPPALGQHTEVIVANLGFGDDESDRLQDSGVFGTPAGAATS